MNIIKIKGLRDFLNVSCWAENRYYVKHIKKKVKGKKSSKAEEIGLEGNYVLFLMTYEWI